MTAQVLHRYPEKLAVVKLGPGSELPSLAGSSTMVSVTATATETSIVCGAAGVPKKARGQGPFTAYAVEGPLDFALTGILADLLRPLAEAEVSVFTLSTYDTDWILVPTEKATVAEDAWQQAGHTVVPAPVAAPSPGKKS